MKVREYRVMEEAVGTGAACAVNRFFKHRNELGAGDTAGRRELQAIIDRAVMESISEWFEFDTLHDAGHDIDHL